MSIGLAFYSHLSAALDGKRSVPIGCIVTTDSTGIDNVLTNCDIDRWSY